MCGIFGAFNVQGAAWVIRNGLHGIQNRGTHAAGIATISNGVLHEHRGPGTVSSVFDETSLNSLVGSMGIGHTRYPTARSSDGLQNTQPLYFRVHDVPYMIVHNGNFTNGTVLEDTALKGTPFVTESDTERFFRLALSEYRLADSLGQAIQTALPQMKGACSAVVAQPDELIAVRDSWGTRPLYWGELPQEDGSVGYVVASETCALNDVGVLGYKEVPVGTILSFTTNGVTELKLPKTPVRLCSFEWVYFAFPTSEVFGVHVAEFRRALGRALRNEHPNQTKLVVGIPDSSNFIAEGYAEAGDMRLDRSLIIRKHDTRTFIQSGQKNREKAVNDKFSFSPELKGLEISIVDDSIVRGTTLKNVIRQLRARGVAKIHVLIGSPPTIDSCYYGIDTPDKSRLIASENDTEAVRKEINADSLHYLSMEGFRNVIESFNVSANDCCFACMNREYFH